MSAQILEHPAVTWAPDPPPPAGEPPTGLEDQPATIVVATPASTQATGGTSLASVAPPSPRPWCRSPCRRPASRSRGRA